MNASLQRCGMGLAAVLALFVSCRREARPLAHTPPASAPRAEDTGLHVYQENAYAVSQGKRLFGWMNCSGCHAHGGGAIGPPLLDAAWRYGASPEEVCASILDGRPNGMPAYRSHITEDQAWQLTAYVRSMSGLLRLDVPPSRNDEMQAREPETRTERRPPHPEATP